MANLVSTVWLPVAAVAFSVAIAPLSGPRRVLALIVFIIVVAAAIWPEGGFSHG